MATDETLKSAGASLCKFCAENAFGRDAWAKAWSSRRAVEELHPVLQFQVPWKQLIDGNSGNCWFCEVLVDNIEQEWEGQLPAELSVHLYYHSPPDVEPQKISYFSVYAKDTRDEGSRGNLVSFPIGTSGSTNDVTASFFLSNTDSSGCWQNFDPDLALKWIDRCRHEHPRCRIARAKQLPHRAIDISRCAMDNIVLLVENDDVVLDEYAALSYCWGPGENIKTTSSTKTKHMQGIPMDSLPRTIKDAVTVTSALKLRYLWVDSLCILQDSKADKVAELTQMRKYFSNATLTIAASKAKTVDDGFLVLKSENSQSHDSAIGGECEVPFYSPDGEAGALSLDKHPRIYDPQKEPISQRCWTLEERLLCPLVLLFLVGCGFALQCNQTETYAGKIIYNHMALEGRQRIFQPLSLFQGKKSGNLSAQDIHDSWLTTITDYGVRQITDPADKLIAIAGLAEEYHTKHGEVLGDYYAGHWRGFLAQSLHWYVTRAQLRRRPPYRAPSWSWASVDGSHYAPVTPNSERYRMYFDVLSISTMLQTPKLPFAGVINGQLELQCSLAEVSWEPKTGGDAIVRLKPNFGPIGQGYPDCIEYYPQNVNNVLLMPLSSYIKDEDGAASSMYSLILTAPQDEQQAYRRIGYAFILGDLNLLWSQSEKRTLILV